jgi:predicted kinase
MTSKAVAVLSGPPGAGKTSVARELAALLGNADIVEVDDIKKERYGDTRCCKPHLDFPEAGRRAVKRLESCSTVIVVEAFAVDEFLELVLQQLPRDVQVDNFLLWCDVDTAVKRATTREVDRITEDDVRRVFACFKGAYPNRRKIDTDAADPSETAAEIATLLQS